MLRPDLRPPDRPASNYQDGPQGPDPIAAEEAPDSGQQRFSQPSGAHLVLNRRFGANAPLLCRLLSLYMFDLFARFFV
jgi:hypothetical protein